jgi:ribosomal protein L31
MSCDLKKTNLVLVAEGSGVYQLGNGESYGEIESVQSLCGQRFDYVRSTDKTIKFKCDIPCECHPLCIVYTKKKNECVVDNSCC